MSSASRGLAPHEGLESLVDEDGTCKPASIATPWAAGRQVWGPPFPERRQLGIPMFRYLVTSFKWRPKGVSSSGCVNLILASAILKSKLERSQK